MSELSEEELLKLTKLCRIECTEEEKITLTSNISKILSYIDLLQEINTEDIAPCTHIMEQASSITRKDLVGPTLSREEFLANAPSHIGGMVRVPPIIKSSN